MLADIRVTGPLDAVWEAAAVAKVRAGQGLFSNILPSRRVWREYIKGSRSIRVFFDALNYIFAEMQKRGRAIPRLRARWWREGADRRRRRPAMKRIPDHRPANPAKAARDIHLQFTIEVLKRVGVRPSRLMKNASLGCRERVGIGFEAPLNADSG